MLNCIDVTYFDGDNTCIHYQYSPRDAVAMETKVTSTVNAPERTGPCREVRRRVLITQKVLVK